MRQRSAYPLELNGPETGSHLEHVALIFEIPWINVTLEFRRAA